MNLRELLIKLAQTSRSLETFVLVDGQPIDAITFDGESNTLTLKSGKWLDERKAEPEKKYLKPKQVRHIRKRYYNK